MRGTRILAIGAVLAALAAGQAKAGEAEPGLLDQLRAVPATELDGERGGTETGGTLINGSVVQGNNSNLDGTNNGNVSVGYGGQKVNGAIDQATVTGNHGITSLMQNTGDLVNMNNATSVNVYLR